nr:translocation/assembly module TamB domain-containing protein [Sphingobacterium gobiense]
MLKITAITLLSIMLLTVLAIFLLRYPAIQTYVTKKVANYLSEELQTDISLESVYFTPFRSLELHNFFINDRNGKTLLSAKSATARISLVKLWNKQIGIQHITLDSAFINYEIYKDSTNVSFLINYFSPKREDQISKSTKMQLDLQRVTLHGNHFKLTDHRFNHHNRGVDFSNLDLTDISGDFRTIRYTDTTIQADVQDFTFKEKSGLYLQEFSAQSYISNTKMEFIDLVLHTNRSKVGDYLAFYYDSFADFSDFIKKVSIEGALNDAFVDSRDIEFFAPDMENVRFTTDVVQASVSGTVEHLKARDVHLKTGMQTSLQGDFTIDGLPNIEQTRFRFALANFQTSAKDAEELVSALSNQSSFSLPDQLHLLETVGYQGILSGYYYLFDVNGRATTALGALSTESTVVIKPTLQYTGTVTATSFDLGTFIRSKEIGATGFDLQYDGKGTDAKSLHLTTHGHLSDLQFKNYPYRHVEFEGEILDGILFAHGEIDDRNAVLAFNGEVNWQDSIPMYEFNSTIAHLDLKRLHLYSRDSIVVSQSNIQTRLHGNSLNSLNGHITADHLQFSTTRGDFMMNYLDFESEGDEQSKKLTLKSDVVDGVMSGQIDLSSIGAYFRSLAMRYAPAINLESRPYNPQNFDLHINVKTFAPISALFDPDLELENGAHLTANFSSDNYTANFDAFSPVVSYKGMKITNLSLTEKADNQAFSLDVTADRFSFSDSAYVDQIAINNVLANDSLTFHVSLSESNRPNYLKLNGNIHFAHNQPANIRFEQSEIILNNESWAINKDADLRVSKGKFYLNNMRIAKDRQEVTLNGILSNEDDKLDIAFKDFSLASLSGITRPLGIDLIGHLSGEMQIYSVFGSPTLSANISTTPIIYNDLPIGNLQVNANFDPQTGLIQLRSQLLDVDGDGITVSGSYDVNSEDEALHLKGAVKNIDLGIVQPFLRTLVSNLYGTMSGEVTINGTIRQPKISGTTHIKDASFLVNYLQTRYHISDQHSVIQQNTIILDNLLLNDIRNATASANGEINLNMLRDPTLTIDVTADNFQILNTARKDNELFFGTAYASGTFRFNGPTSAMVMDIDARPDPNTVITLPFNTSLKVSDNDFIYFVNPNSAEQETPISKRLFQGLTMNMNITVTPDAEINLENNIGSLTGVGTGDISLRISSLGDFEMFGDYHIISGKFHFTAQDFFNKFFDLKEGGTIRWAGNPAEAIINLSATYQQRTSIAPLYNAAGRAENNDRILAQADMILKGTLSQPDVSFDLNFPQTPYIKDELQGYLSDINNVNQQAISLIVRRSFTPASTQEFGREVNNTLLSAGTEIAFNQLNSIISHSLNMNFLDLNIRSFNDASASLRFFDDRLVFTGGVTDRSQSQLNDLTLFSDQIATDAEVTFRLRQDGNLVLRAYNRLNTRNFLFTPYSDYISAVGVVYRQEFNSLSEFWRKLWLWNERKKREDE